VCGAAPHWDIHFSAAAKAWTITKERRHLRHWLYSLGILKA
jgi:hypothetical protein